MVKKLDAIKICDIAESGNTDLDREMSDSRTKNTASNIK